MIYDLIVLRALFGHVEAVFSAYMAPAEIGRNSISVCSVGASGSGEDLAYPPRIRLFAPFAAVEVAVQYLLLHVADLPHRRIRQAVYRDHIDHDLT